MKKARFSYLILLGCVFANATAWGSTPSSMSNIQGVASLFGGFSKVKISNAQTFTGTDDEVFTYNSQSNNNTPGLIGGFLGVQYPLNFSGLYMQTGLEYTNFSPVTVNGTNNVGNEPATYTAYNYDYSFKSQQWLVATKLFTTIDQIFHPYLSIGLGIAVNDSSNFSATPAETGSFNLTPSFANNRNTNFSYSAGFGFDVSISPHLSAGLSYRYVNLGKSSLGSGAVTMNNYSAPVDFSPSSSNIYANEFLFQLTYLI